MFPNNKFIFTEWCDVCLEKLVAHGVYSLERGKIVLVYQYVNAEYKNRLADTSLNAMYGYIEKEGYSEGFIAMVINDAELMKLEAGQDSFNFMMRQAEYPDWQSIYDSFINNKDNGGKAPSR